MDISASDLNNRLNSDNLTILDVREKIEYHTYNIGGTNIPLGMIQSITDYDFNKNDEIIVVCQKGIRSKAACVILKSLGYLNVRNLKGGLTAIRKLNEF
jgi:rhodanese-related sulfurtransferase